MYSQRFLMSPACLAKPFIILVNSKPSGGPEPRGTPKSLNLVKMVEFRGIPAILVSFTKTAPETVFWVEIHPETHSSCPGPLKKHRKSIGFVGVCAPGPPKHDFHPTGLKMGGNHTIFMKCGENHYIITKMGYFGSNPAKGGNTLPRTLLNTILLQPSEKSSRACDSKAFLFSRGNGKS